MASIRDVARKANVGPATVSRVLNNSGYVSEETRRKIEAAMKELNYTPNELARNLFHKKSGIIAILVPSVSHPFFAELVKCVETELYACGYKTMLCDTFREENSEQEYLDMLNRNIVDGIITGVHSLKIEEYLKIDKPIVAFDRYLGENIPLVRVDHTVGGRMAAELLLNSGCKNVLQFQGAKSVRSPSDRRHLEFERVMRENHAEVTSIELMWNRFDSEYFSDITEKIMKEYPDIDGVFGADLLMVYCMKAAVALGRKIPSDLKLVAYDGTYVTEAVTPSITSIVQPIPSIAKELVELLCNMIEHKTISQREKLMKVSIRYGNTTIGKNIQNQ